MCDLSDMSDSSELLSCSLRDGRGEDDSAGMLDSSALCLLAGDGSSSSGWGCLPNILTALNTPHATGPGLCVTHRC